MSMSDPIADMLTRIRNANRMKHDKVEIPASRLKSDILSVLKDHEKLIIDGFDNCQKTKQMPIGQVNH